MEFVSTRVIEANINGSLPIAQIQLALYQSILYCPHPIEHT